MNPISLVTSAITHPTRTVGAVASTAVDVAGLGLRTTARVVGWAAGRAAGSTTEPTVPTSLRPVDVDAPVDRAPAEEPVTTTTTTPPATTASGPATDTATATDAEAEPETTAERTAGRTPAKTSTKKAVAQAPAKKAPAKKAPARRAASKKAAVVAPALGISEEEALEVELDQLGTEPVIDEGTVNAVASEAEMMARAADPDKG